MELSSAYKFQFKKMVLFFGSSVNLLKQLIIELECVEWHRQREFTGEEQLTAEGCVVRKRLKDSLFFHSF